MRIGENIAVRRKQKGVTQEQLAAAVGVSAPAVSKWENNLCCPDIELLLPLARYLGCTTDSLLSFSPALSQRELFEQVSRVSACFEKEGRQRGLEEAQKLVRTYPDDQRLRMKLAAAVWQALILEEERGAEFEKRSCRKEASKTAAQWAFALLRPILEDKESRFGKEAEYLAVFYSMQMGVLQKAEACLETLPETPQKAELCAELYLAQGDLRRAEESSEKLFQNYGLAAVHALRRLLAVCEASGQEARVEKLAGTYRALEDILGFVDGAGEEYLIRSLKRQGREREAVEVFSEQAEKVRRAAENKIALLEKNWESFGGQRLLETYRRIFADSETYRWMKDWEAYTEVMREWDKKEIGEEPI